LDIKSVSSIEKNDRLADGALHARIVAEHAGGLGERLDDEELRHDIPAARLPAEEPFRVAHVLHDLDVASGVAVDHAVDQQEREAVRHVTKDFVDICRASWILSRHATPPSLKSMSRYNPLFESWVGGSIENTGPDQARRRFQRQGPRESRRIRRR